MVDENGPTYYVVFQSPGPKWLAGTPYNEQPEFWDHVKYMEECHAKGNILLSGPFMEGVGVMAAGGMTVFKAANLEEATALGSGRSHGQVRHAQGRDQAVVGAVSRLSTSLALRNSCRRRRTGQRVI